jgi:hypothetical protein
LKGEDGIFRFLTFMQLSIVRKKSNEKPWIEKKPR